MRLDSDLPEMYVPIVNLIPWMSGGACEMITTIIKIIFFIRCLALKSSVIEVPCLTPVLVFCLLVISMCVCVCVCVCV